MTSEQSRRYWANPEWRETTLAAQKRGLDREWTDGLPTKPTPLMIAARNSIKAAEAFALRLDPRNRTPEGGA